MRSKSDRASKIVQERLQQQQEKKLKNKSNATGLSASTSSSVSTSLPREETNATKESKAIDEEKEIHDPFGLHITRLLNQGAFAKINKSKKKDEEERQSSIFPLFSSSNYTIVRNGVNYSWSFMYLLFIESGSLRTEGENTASNANPTWTHSIGTALGILIFVVIPTMSIGIAIIILAIIKLYLFLILSIVALFIDVRDLYSAMPRFVQKVVDKSIYLLQEIDRKVLFADLLKGRDQWNEKEVDRYLVDRTAPQALCIARNAALGGESDALSKEKSFQNVDWSHIPNALADTPIKNGGLHSKTVDHLVAVNFAYAMMHGDHKSLQKKCKKQIKKQQRPTGKSERAPSQANTHSIDLSISDSATDCEDLVPTNFSDLVNEPGVETMALREGIETIKLTPMRPLRRQRSRRTSMMSYDEVENIDDYDATERPRIQSEADMDFYEPGASDENSLDNASNDENSLDKNKKWLDVGARIGMRLLKSEHIQDLIAQNQLASGASLVDRPQEFEDDLEFAGSMDVGHLESPKSQIPKPFHTMWQSQGFDSTSEGYVISDSESESTPAEFMSFSPPRSQPSRRKSSSPVKRMRSAPVSRRSSVPSTLKRLSSADDMKKLNSPNEIGGDISVTSSEAMQLVPKEFDANRHLPAAMAINRGVIYEESPTSNYISHSKATKTRIADSLRTKGCQKREPLLQGVKMMVPLFPSYTGKAIRTTVERRALLLATVFSSDRIALIPSSADSKHTDAISITVLLDKSFLRNGKFAKMTLRIPDSQRYFPRYVYYYHLLAYLLLFYDDLNVRFFTIFT